MTLFRFPALSAAVGAFSSSTHQSPVPRRNLYWNEEPASAKTLTLNVWSPLFSPVYSISCGCHSGSENPPATNMGGRALGWRYVMVTGILGIAISRGKNASSLFDEIQ